MDELAGFLLEAEWQQTGQYTYFCTDSRRDDFFSKFAATLPSSLHGYGLQAWKTTGRTETKGSDGYILPVLAIKDEPPARLVDGPFLTPGSDPVSFKQGDTISGHLYYVIALPPPSINRT